jgi:hypothetical protein
MKNGNLDETFDATRVLALLILRLLLTYGAWDMNDCTAMDEVFFFLLFSFLLASSGVWEQCASRIELD